MPRGLELQVFHLSLIRTTQRHLIYFCPDLQDLLIRVGALKVDDPRARRPKHSDDGMVTDPNGNDEDDWD